MGVVPIVNENDTVSVSVSSSSLSLALLPLCQCSSRLVLDCKDAGYGYRTLQSSIFLRIVRSPLRPSACVALSRMLGHIAPHPHNSIYRPRFSYIYPLHCLHQI